MPHSTIERPWATWVSPSILSTTVGDILAGYYPANEEGIGGGLAIIPHRDAPNEAMAITPSGLVELGRAVQFPPDFVSSLPHELAAQVINTIFSQRASNQSMQMLVEHGTIVGIVKDRRPVLSAADACEVALETLAESYGNEVEVEEAILESGAAHLRLKLPLAEPITPKEGDVLQGGVVCLFNPGQLKKIGNYEKRLICTNGMTTTGEKFTWSRKDEEISLEAQMDWIRENVMVAANEFHRVVERARHMATIVVENPEQALRDRLRAMRINKRWFEQIEACFAEEPGDTEWHLLNAITRFASHHPGLDLTQRNALQSGCGDWCASFDMVEARLPRPIAIRVGAEIITRN